MRIAGIISGCIGACLLVAAARAQITLYDIDTIQKIEIYFSQPNWDYRMDTAKYGSEGYTMADWVKINGVLFDSAGIKYKGNSSYDSTKIKNPFHIDLGKFKDQDYQGISDIKLSNFYQDPSMIREPLAYAILSNYMDCPRSNFAQVYINGNYIGIYSNDEDINKGFLKRHFYNYSKNENVFFKCSHPYPSSSTKCNLKYISNDSTQYMSLYELKTNYGWNDLVNLCDTVTNYSSQLGSYMDMDRVIWMLAFNNVLINFDSYSGYFSQNYYLYKDNSNRFNSIVWDLNMAFGGFAFAGNQSGGLGSLTVTDMQQLSPLLHGMDADWPLIMAVNANPMYKRMYIAHLRTITQEMFAGNYYKTIASQMQGIADTAVLSDGNNSFSYAQFQNGLTTNTPVGSYTVPGIYNLMDARATYLQSTPEFAAAPPVITNVSSSVSGSNVTVWSIVTNTNSNAVYLGYRFDTTGKFTRVLLYDDGNHNDGGANDNKYGLTLNLDSANMQFYIYAENNNAGIFSPERAEHEFHRIGDATSIAGLNAVHTGFNMYPNPAHDKLHLNFMAENSTPCLLMVLDVLGKKVLGQYLMVNKGKNTTSVDLAGLTPGVYQLILAGNGVMNKARFVVE